MGLVDSKPQAGVCRRRSPKSVSPPPTKAEGNGGKTVLVSAPSKILEKPPQKLQVSTWRDLLQEKPSILNPDAIEFQPSGLKLPPGLTEPVVVDDEEPEWLQYLSKKAAGLQAPPNLDKPTINNFIKRTARAEPCRPFTQDRDRNAQDRDRIHSLIRPSNERDGGHAFQTSEYLKILKEAPKSKPPGPKPKKKLGPSSNAGATSLSQMANAEFPGSVPMGPVQWTAAWRAHVTRTSVTLGQGEDADDVVRFAQDDTFVEKLAKDEDLSDPAYLSDVESRSFRGPSEKNASWHYLGRRPRHADTSVRSYVMQDLSHHLDGLVATTLLRLQRFSDEGKNMLEHQPNRAPPRRFIIGLREVARRMKQGKLACIIVAPDIEEDQDNGGLDDRMRELLASAYGNGVPVIFALSRARIGCALAKTVQVSVFAIMDATGAKALLDESVQLAQSLRQSWLSRLEKKNKSAIQPEGAKVQSPVAAASPWRRTAPTAVTPCAGRAA